MWALRGSPGFLSCLPFPGQGWGYSISGTCPDLCGEKPQPYPLLDLSHSPGTTEERSISEHLAARASAQAGEEKWCGDGPRATRGQVHSLALQLTTEVSPQPNPSELGRPGTEGLTDRPQETKGGGGARTLGERGGPCGSAFSPQGQALCQPIVGSCSQRLSLSPTCHGACNAHVA